MHFRNRIISILVIAAVTLGLFVYARTERGADSEEDAAAAALSQQKETIHFWYSDEAMTDFINSAAVAFGEAYDVRVFPKLVSEMAYVEAINEATLRSDQMPDAYLINHDSLEKAYLAGLAAEIQDPGQIVDPAHFSTAALDAVTYRDKLVGYPLFFETSALLYNESYLSEWARQQAERVAEEVPEDAEEIADTEVSEGEETAMEGVVETLPLGLSAEEYMLYAIPASMDDMLMIADSFDLPEGVEGIFRWDVSDVFYNYYFVGNYLTVGGDTGDDEEKIDINNPETKACLEVYKSLNQFFSIETETVTYDSVIQDFIDGKIVFTIATTDVISRLAEARADESFTYDYGIARLPDPSGELAGRALSVTGTVAVNGYSEHQETANRFAAFLVGEYADELYERSGKAPANIGVNTDNGALMIFREEYADSIPLPKLMETSNLWVQLELLFYRVWNGEDVNVLVEELAEQILSQIS